MASAPAAAHPAPRIPHHQAAFSVLHSFFHSIFTGTFASSPISQLQMLRSVLEHVQTDAEIAGPFPEELAVRHVPVVKLPEKMDLQAVR